MATEAVELGKNSRKNHTVWVYWFLTRALSKTLKERDELRLKTTLMKAEKENHKAFYNIKRKLIFSSSAPIKKFSTYATIWNSTE